MDSFIIKQLTADDWKIWKEFRLEALKKSRVAQLHLTCVTSNLGALALYQKHGFKIYGEEPNALKIDNQYFHEYMMILELKTI